MESDLPGVLNASDERRSERVSSAITSGAAVDDPSSHAADEALAAASSNALPVVDPSRDLPEPAKEILHAARRLLQEGGFDALRLDAIVKEAGKNKASVKYYFGNKQGLLYALVDSLDHDQCLAMAERTRGLSGQERLRQYIEGQTCMARDDSFLMFFDTVPHVMRDEELRARVSRLYEWYREMNLIWLGLTECVNDENRERLAAFADLMVAIVDGLALQVLLNAEGFCLDSSFAILELFLHRTLDEIVKGPMQE